MPSSVSSSLPERLDPADDHEKIVLARQREHRVDEIVPRALVAQVDFQAVGEEGEEVRSSRESRIVRSRRRSTRMVIGADNLGKLGPLGELALVSVCTTAPARLASELDVEHAAQTAAFMGAVSGSRSPFSSTIRITPSAARRSA